jgi:hypothetical protein
MNLLEDSEDYCKLHKALDYWRKCYGQDAVKRAIVMGSMEIGRINPFNGEPPTPAHRRA